jgi:hypothetical protein
VSLACVLIACGLAGLPYRKIETTREIVVKPMAVDVKLQDQLASDD